MASDKKKLLIDTALALFNREGFHATGIDTILAKSGVAKMTLYHHFRSKDDLVLAVLQRLDEQFRAQLRQEVHKRAAKGATPLLAVFDGLELMIKQGQYCGCLFMKAVGEFSAFNDLVRQQCTYHKQCVYDYIFELAQLSRVHDAESLASQWCILMDGAVVQAVLHKNPKWFRIAKVIAQSLLQTNNHK